MGFFSSMISGAVKTVLSPLAVVKDAVDVVTGNEPTATKDLVESTVKDAKEAIDNLTDGEL